MKKWVTPRGKVENFRANDYVAACYNYQATLYCAIPGKDTSHVLDGEQAVWGPDGYSHGGPCATGSTMNVSGHTAVENSTRHEIRNIMLGREVDSEKAECSLDIGSNSGLKETAGTSYYLATWENYDGNSWGGRFTL